MKKQSQDSRRVVLHVEDDDSTAYLFRYALERSGIDMHVFRATDGEQGLSFLLRRGAYRDAPRPDLVILDINVPKVSGFEVLDIIRSRQELKDLPVVVFSSSMETEDWKRALSLGARAYFTKSGDWMAFLATVKSICDLVPEHGRYIAARQAPISDAHPSH